MTLEIGLKQDANSQPAKGAPATRPGAQSDTSVDDLFNKLQSDMRRPDLSQEAITAAFHAIQQLASDTDSEAEAAATADAAVACAACGAANPPHNRFCAACGVTLRPASGPAAAAAPARVKAAALPGVHHYHHHYHHYFAPGEAGALPPGLAPGATSAPATARDLNRLRTPVAGSALSRAETAVRRMTVDWAQACNTRHLDDLVELYVPDALVLRSNIPPVRGTAAIREFFFTALDAGLGEVELEPLRVELFGDFAYEAGRCKMLVPVVVGKRREERGKYVMLFARQPAADWKVMLDSWSSDLSLTADSESPAKPGAGPAASRLPRR